MPSNSSFQVSPETASALETARVANITSREAIFICSKCEGFGECKTQTLALAVDNDCIFAGLSEIRRINQDANEALISHTTCFEKRESVLKKNKNETEAVHVLRTKQLRKKSR